MMHALALALGAGGRVAWSPSALGASLLGFWDAERSDLITHSSGAVSSWRDVIGGYDAAQSVAGAKPTYSATSFNNRPGITFDGADDELTYAGVGAFPLGATPSEIWALVDQQALVADATNRDVVGYGGTTTANTRRVRRIVNGGVNRAQGVTGDGTTTVFPQNNGTDFSGMHVVRVVFDNPSHTDVDGVAGGNSAGALNTVTSRTRIGAAASQASPAAYFQGRVSAILITSTLTAAQATQLYAYLNARRA